jgi:hypothetical protein
MYKLLEIKYVDVWLFYLSGFNKVVYISRLEDKNGNRNLYVNGLQIQANSLLLKNNQVFNFNGINTDLIYDLQNEKILSLNSEYIIGRINNEKVGLLSKVDSNWNVTTGYGNINSSELEFTFEKQINPVSFYEENAFYLCFNDDDRTTISCFIPKNIDYEWHFTLHSLKITHPEKIEKYGEFEMKINHIVGVLNDILWMDIDVSMNGSFLLRLGTGTGKCVHFLDTVEYQNHIPTEKDFIGLPCTTFTTHDVKRNILLGFAPDTLHWQVDLSSPSPTIKMWSLKDEMTKHHAFVGAYMGCGISDSHIFFPVGSLGSTPQVFALNRESLKVDWQYFFTEGGQYFTPTKVEVTDTHLYVLDNTGTLHIFEKTEDN